MAVFNLTGSDTIVLNDRVFNNLADGDAVTISFSNDLVKGSTGKNKNTIFALDEQGNNATVVMRIMRGSSDDQFMNTLLTTMLKDFSAFPLINGSFVKRLGDGTGEVVVNNYQLTGGVFQKNVDTKDNVQGETEQGVSVYNLFFANVIPGIQ
jgi:hypothetical protein